MLWGLAGADRGATARLVRRRGIVEGEGGSNLWGVCAL